MTNSRSLETVPYMNGENGDTDILDYMSIIARNKWPILVCAFALAALATIIVFSMEPVYRSTATLLIDTQKKQVVSIREMYDAPDVNDEYFVTQNQILQSRELARRVINKLNLFEHPEFDPAQANSGFSPDPRTWLPDGWFSGTHELPVSEHELENNLINTFLSRLEVSPVRDTQIITISFNANDPVLAADVPNALVDAYIGSNLESRLGMTRQAVGWITEGLDDLRVKVEESEKALQDYREKENLVDVGGVDRIVSMELDNITGNLVDARHRLAEATTLLNQINELRGAPISEYGSIPAVLSDPGVRSARETQARAQARVSELAERYGPMHPTMVSAKSELDEANRTLTEQVRDVISSVRRQYEVSRAKVDELTAALASTKQDVSNINSKQANLHALEREVENNRQLYDIFVTRLKEANVTSDMQSANARVIDSATVSSVPVKPKKALIILATFFLGLTGSTFLSFLTEALDNTLKFSADVEQKLHLQVLGLLPKLPGKLIGGKLRSIRYYTGHNEGIFAENIRTVRTNILLNNYDEKKKMIVITSSIQGEGKSTLAVNLALSLAYLGKTLLIDADMRHPIVAKIFKLKHRQAIGLSDFIADGLPANKCIQDLHDEGLFVMPAGTPPPNPQELLSSDRFRQAIPLLRNSFDYIVIDSAPIIPVSDAVILSGYVDEVIYVVKANDTPYHLAQEGIKLLKQVEAPITGVVLNQVSLSNNVGPYGYYLADYYRTSGYLNQNGSNSV